MRFIPLLSGQTGRRLFSRRTCGVDFGWDKSCRIDTNASSYWSARTAAYSSHPEVLPSRWPLSVTRGRHSIIYQHIAPIYFTEGEKVTLCRGSVSPSLSTGRVLQTRGQRCSRVRGEGSVSAGLSSRSLRQLPDYQRQSRYDRVTWFKWLTESCETLTGDLLNETMRHGKTENQQIPWISWWILHHKKEKGKL